MDAGVRMWGWAVVDEGSAWLTAVLVTVWVLCAIGTTIHVLLTKESPRAAAGWVALAWMSPVLGTLAYVMLGINRVARKAAKLRAGGPRRVGPEGQEDHTTVTEEGEPLAPLQIAMASITGQPLLAGNRVMPLIDGDETYPAMLEAIDRAEHTLAYMTFIWDRDAWGERFVEAFARAKARGVEIRLLLDGVGGTAFSWPHTIGPSLRRAGLSHARFLAGPDPRRLSLLNLRNHRKVLVVDGRVGFTGGMNIRGSFVAADAADGHAHRDLHARVDGPVVRELMELFAVDWAFTTGERLEGERWFPRLSAVGDMRARVIPDGPDEDMEKAELAFLEALTCARRRVRILTPYFLPEEGLQAALAGAARRGVRVDVLVPSANNQPLVQRAMEADLPRLLAHGVNVWAQPPPFDHTKLMVVDDHWSCFGSANWDPRSLRLNFEMLLEVYSEELAAAFIELFDGRMAAATRYDRRALLTRPLGARLRDGAVRLFRPYL